MTNKTLISTPTVLLPAAMAHPGMLLYISWAMAMISTVSVGGIGVNWGNQASHPLNPDIVVKMLKNNGISRVKLFDADSWTLNALSNTGIEVMVAIPNDQLSSISKDYGNAKNWVKENVTQYFHDGGVNIKYVAVGNEPFLTSYKGAFVFSTFPALKNIQKALDEAGIGEKIKAVVPLNADVYDSASGIPSGGAFRPDIRNLMIQIVRFLHSNGAPFVVNIYPFLSLHQNSHFPVNFAFFDGGSSPITDRNVQYTNVFDANFDTLVWALKMVGINNMKIIVGEVGWPTDGTPNANKEKAKRFYDGFFKKMATNKGTPLRPGHLEVYLFGLVDENMKSVQPGNFERHWGLFTFDGKPKFPVDMSGKGNDRLLVSAKGVEYLQPQWCVMNPRVKDVRALAANVEYACSAADCTPLAYGGSCNHLGDPAANASYAFNIYFQMQDQDVRACDFQGLAVISSKNASRNECLFPVQILSAGESLIVRILTLVVSLVAAAAVMFEL